MFSRFIAYWARFGAVVFPLKPATAVPFAPRGQRAAARHPTGLAFIGFLKQTLAQPLLWFGGEPSLPLVEALGLVAVARPRGAE